MMLRLFVALKALFDKGRGNSFPKLNVNKSKLQIAIAHALRNTNQQLTKIIVNKKKASFFLR